MPRAVTIVSEEELAQRRRRGLDKRDEMWQGVLHMVPPPGTEHQEFAGSLEHAIRDLLCEADPKAFVAQQVALADPSRWPEDFRVPDIVVCHEGRGVEEKYVTRADLVVELRSEEDETYEKLPFYAARGVDEIMVIERASNTHELHRRSADKFLPVPAEPGGWLRSRVGLQFRWDTEQAALYY